MPSDGGPRMCRGPHRCRRRGGDARRPVRRRRKRTYVERACRQTRTRIRDKENKMSLFLDKHNLHGATAEAVAEAHAKDLETQGRYGVNYLKYWFDEDKGTVFCLIEAPDKDAANQVHREAHGLVAD